MSSQEDFNDGKSSSANPFEAVNYTDPRLALISDKIAVPVVKGGDQITPYVAQASSASSAGLSFNVIVPSMQTVLAPVVYIKSKVVISFTANGAAGNAVFAQGIDENFGPFPLQSSFGVCTATFNQAGITFEANENLPMLQKLIPKKLMKKYATICPAAQDVFLDYETTPPFYDNIIPNASLKQCNRGSWFDPTMTTATNVVGTGGNLSGTITVTFVEPLLIPPFCLSNEDGYSTGGLSGLSTFRLQLNFSQSGLQRMIRSKTSGNGAASTIFTINSVTTTQADSSLQLFYITPHASVSIPRRNIHPYLNIIRSTTAIGNALPAQGAIVDLNPVQMGVMPKKILIGCRLATASQTCKMSDFWVPISGVNLTLNNRSGLLSSCSQHQLYEMAVEAGLQGVDYDTWKGSKCAPMVAPAGPATNYVPASIPTVGGFVVLDVARHLAVDDMYAPESIGTFNFYGKVTLNPLFGAGANLYPAGNYEMVVLMLNESLLINELGASAITSGLFDKATVLSVSTQAPYKRRYRGAIIGGASAWMSKAIKNLKSGAGKASGLAYGSEPRSSGLSAKLASRLM
jgi:hypothetical protein